MLFCIFKFCLISSYLNSRGVFRSQSNIYDEAFCENRLRLSAVNCFHKKLRLRCSTGLSKRLWIASCAEYFASLNLSRLCYCINKKTHSNLYEKQKTKKLSIDYRSIFLLCADAYLDNATGCFYNFQNMQQAIFPTNVLCR